MIDLRRREFIWLLGGAAMAWPIAVRGQQMALPTGDDPVHVGLVTSLNRPGGNVTGITFLLSALVAKRLELLRELVPGATIIAFLVDPTFPTAEPATKEAEAAARALGFQLLVLNVNSEGQFEMAFATLLQHRAGGLVINANPLFTSHSNQLVALAARHAVPTIYQLREAIEAGGLISYGASFADAYRQAGIYAGRILKGEKPADLPVMRPTKFEVVINLRTAKALGIKFSDNLLSLADEVIE
jgi:putative tryptophan/tyrosine transport system substrate-binding protein